MDSAIIGEFVGAEYGLGNVILITSSQLNMALLFAALVILTVLSLILFALLRLGREEDRLVAEPLVERREPASPIPDRKNHISSEFSFVCGKKLLTQPTGFERLADL